MNVYICRKHLIEPLKVTIGMMLYVIGLFAVFSSISYLSASTSEKDNIFYTYGSSLLIIIALLIITYVILYNRKLKKYNNLSIAIGNNNLIYKSINGTSIIPYEDISELEFALMKYSKGWIKIICKNETIKLDVAIENMGMFLKELKEKLDGRGLSNIYDEKKMYNYYITSSYSDKSWERIYELANLIPPTVTVNVIVAFIFSFLVYERPIKLIVAGMLFIFPIIVIITYELILAIKHILEFKEDEFTVVRRNREYEKKVFKLVLLSYACIMTALLSYFLLKF